MNETSGCTECPASSEARNLVISCSVFRPQLEALTEKHTYNAQIEYYDSKYHLTPSDIDRVLGERVRNYTAGGGKVYLVCGECSAGMDDLAGMNGVSRINGCNCVEIILGREVRKKLMKKRAFILFHEWAIRWREILLGIGGLPDDLSRQLIRDSHELFVYLDDGYAPPPKDALYDCASFFGLPVEIMKTDSDAVARYIDGLRADIDRPGPNSPGAEAVDSFLDGLRADRGEGADAAVFLR